MVKNIYLSEYLIYGNKMLCKDNENIVMYKMEPD